MDRCLFGEEKVGAVKGKIAVNLVCGDLMIALDAVLAAGVHHSLCTHDVCFKEHAGIFDRAVNMALSSEVHHNVGGLLLKKLENSLSVGDRCLYKAETWVVHNAFERGKVARIGKAVKADYPVVGIFFQHMENEVGAYKACSACYDNGHILFLPYIL